MRIESGELLTDLSARTREIIREAEGFQKSSLKELNYKEAPEKWSALECIAHLNRYGDFYLPEIENQIRESGYAPEKVFKSGFLGNYFAESMLPKKNFKKMKTFRDKDPIGSRLDKEEIGTFLVHQHKLLELLDAAREVSLGKTKTAVSISKWIKLKLGDTFRVVIYHNQRHLVQAKKALKAAGSAGSVVKEKQ